MIEDYFKLGWKNLRERKLRSWLTVLGIFIGIAAVVSLVSLGQGLKASIDEQFEMMGVDKIIIFPAGGLFGIGTDVVLTEDDLETSKDASGVKLATGYIFKLGRVERKDELIYTFVMGMPQDESKAIFMDMASIEITRGRDLKEGDQGKVLLGYNFFQDDLVFEDALEVGDKIEVEGKSFKVVGGMSEIGNPQDDANVYLTLDVARDVLDMSEDYHSIIVQVKDSNKIGKIAEDIEEDLRDIRDVEEGEEDFVIQTTEDLREGFQTVFTVVNSVLIGLAAISLFVGGVGIMNTMFTAVLQRTNEIGVMKAIGATNKSIAILFIIESGIIGLAGGAAGIVFGIIISKMIELLASIAGYSFFSAGFSWYLIVGSLAFSFLVGVLSGVLPAIQASRMKPVDALRYE